MRVSVEHTRTLSRFALAAVAFCSATAIAPAQVPFPVTSFTSRSYDVSMNTGANRALDMGWLGQHNFFNLATGASLGTPFGSWSAWALTPDKRMVRTAVMTKTRALTAGINFNYPGWGTTGGTIQLFNLASMTPAPTLVIPPFSSAPIVPNDMTLARSDTLGIINGEMGVIWVQLSNGAIATTTHAGGPFTNTIPRFCYGSMIQSVIANDKRAVILRNDTIGGAIDLYDTTPFPGAAPVLISTTRTFNAVGGQVAPYDLAISPNQTWVGVMTNVPLVQRSGNPFLVLDGRRKTEDSAIRLPSSVLRPANPRRTSADVY